MRFLSDMGISPKTVTFLQNFGYDAIHLHEMGLDKLPDSDILEKSVNEGSILLTHDLDFGELLSRKGIRRDCAILSIPSIQVRSPANLSALDPSGFAKHCCSIP